MLLAASVIFLGDVFCRRVMISFGWLPALWRGCRGPAGAARRPPRRSRWSAQALEGRRSPQTSRPGPHAARAAGNRGFCRKIVAPTARRGVRPPPPRLPNQREALAADAEPASYTSRLLAAKERALAASSSAPTDVAPSGSQAPRQQTDFRFAARRDDTAR